MTTIRRIFRPATRVAAATAILLGGIIGAPAAFASQVPPPGTGDTITPAALVTARTVTVGGTPGWQIVLFMVAAAVLSATVAVLVDRMLTARHRDLAPSAR